MCGGRWESRRWNVFVLRTFSALIASALLVVACTAETDDSEVAADLVEAWVAGWNADDPGEVAAVFTEDGVLLDPLNQVIEGRDAIESYVERHDNITEEVCDLTGLTETTAGVFTTPCTFRSSGDARAGDLEITLEGDLASQIQWLNLRFVTT